MKNQIIRSGEKIVVRFNSENPSDAAIRRMEKILGCTLNYCDSKDGHHFCWNGPSNVRYAGWQRWPRRAMRRLGDSENVVRKFDTINTPVRAIVRRIQSAYSKLRYTRKWNSRIYEGLIRPKANGFTVCDF